MKDYISTVDPYEISPQTVARTILFFISIINFFLIKNGYYPLNIEENVFIQYVSEIFTLVMAIRVWWKNNPITKKAVVANQVMDNIEALTESGVINYQDGFSVEIVTEDRVDKLEVE